MSELLDQIEARAEDARRNRESYSKESRSRRITNEESAKDVPRLLAAVRTVEGLHEPRTVHVITGDCATEECDHEEGCPTVPVDVCAECYRVSEEADAYFSERNIAHVAYPCPTIRALIEALEGE